MIRLIAWNDAARDALACVEDLDIPITQSQVNDGSSQLWECTDADGVAGYVVTRLVDECGLREWFWVACAGRHYHQFVPAFLEAAREYSLPVRVYVTRPGMQRIYQRLGFKHHGTVMRLQHGMA